MSKRHSRQGKSAPSGFFCYSAKDAAGTTLMERTTKLVYRKANIELIDFKTASKGGGNATERALRMIDEREVFLADVTGLDPNIMFLLGYAAGRRKPVFVCIQGYSSTDRLRDLKELEVLSTFDVHSYQNSDDLSDAVRNYFLDDRPSELDRFFSRSDVLPGEKSGLFLKGLHRHEIALAALNSFRRRFEPVYIDDWNEDGAQPLTWYIRSVVQSRAVMALLIDPAWDQSKAVNARFAFVCGMAVALDRKVLMVGPPGFDIQYVFREWLRTPATGPACERVVEDSFSEWDSPTTDAVQPKADSDHVTEQFHPDSSSKVESSGTIATFPESGIEATEEDVVLLHINIGEPVAENEEYDLVEYFVKTGQYTKISAATQALVVGAKGTGKTAMYFQLREEFSENKRNLVCHIKPTDYMVSLFLHALRTVSGDRVSHITDSAWKLIAYAQLLRALSEGLDKLPVQANLSSDQETLRQFVKDYAFLVEAPFEKQLETAAQWLEEVAYDGTNFSSAIHSKFLSQARKVLVPHLSRCEKTIILVDNLDKAWQVDSDLRLQAQMVFSVLGLSRRIRTDLGMQLDVRTIVFLRRNIFEYIISNVAREEDKVTSDATELTWDDRDTLLRVIDQRFRVAGEQLGWAGDPWETFFTPLVDDVPTRDWIFAHVLPRPRDLIKYLKMCIEVAINRNHKRIEADDLKEALKSHSAFALLQILAEYKAEEPWLQQALYSFMGTQVEWSFKELENHLTSLNLDRKLPRDIRDALATLVAIRFLGVRLESGEIRHASTIEDGIMLTQKVRVHADSSPLTFSIHPVFHSRLGITAKSPPVSGYPPTEVSQEASADVPKATQKRAPSGPIYRIRTLIMRILGQG